MTYKINPFLGIFNVYNEFENIKKADQLKGITMAVVMIALLNGILTGLITFISPALDKQLSSMELEIVGNMKAFAAIGGGIFGFFLPLLITSAYTILWWLFFSEVGFFRNFLIQIYSYIITLIFLVTQISFFYIFNIDVDSSPLSLGLISEYFTDNTYLITVFNGLSIFWLWGVIFQTITLNMFTNKKFINVLLLVLTLNIIVTAILSTWA